MNLSETKRTIVQYIAFASSLLFVVLALLLYNRYHNVVVSMSNYATLALQTESNYFFYHLLSIFALALIVIFLCYHLLNHERASAVSISLLANSRCDAALSILSENDWEYQIENDVMIKYHPNSGIFSDMDRIEQFRSYALDSSLIHPDDRETILHMFEQMLSHDKEPLHLQIRAYNAAGEESWYELYASKVFNPNGIPISLIGRTVNISNRKAREAQQKETAGQDHLTKLYNYEKTTELIDHYLNTVEYSVISALFLIDIDHFTQVSEQLSTSFSDAILLDLSVRLRKRFGTHDIISRIGKDTFSVFLAEAPSVSYIEEIANELCNLIREVYSNYGPSTSVTASIGVAVFPVNGNQFEQLAEAAARALTEAKRSGGDRYYLYRADMQGGDYFLPRYTDMLPENDSFEDHSLVNTNIIVNAIDILFDSQEGDNSIRMLLSLIGTYYNLDRICIIQYFDTNQNMSITHEWASDNEYRIQEYFKNIPIAKDSLFAMYRNNSNGIFYTDEFQFPNMDLIPFHTPLDDEEHPLFECGFSEHGSYVGYVAASIRKGSHGWNQNEIDSLAMISKIIGSYISRLRSIRYANWIKKNDTLTNAYNFNTFLSEVNKQHTNSNEQVAMLYSDIRQFKLINDNYGYQVGDFILKSIATIYRENFPDGMICRISGDKFALFTPYSDVDALTSQIKKVISHCKQLSSSQGQSFKLSLVIGVYLMSPSDTAIIAVDRANIARKSVQTHESSAGYAYFTNTMRSSMILQKDLEDAMETSILENHFMVYFQPKFNILSKKLCGAEVLVRWQHPTLGFLYPNTFIPLFESNGFIVDLDYYMFEHLCMFLRDRIKEGCELVPISVNLSREHFRSDDLPEKLKAAVDFYNVPAEMIEIEITESAFTTVDRHFINLLDRIRDYGFRLAMDDFGSGLSSLNLLSDLPFNMLKIDKDFFHTKTTNERERIVISNIVRMAYELQMDVICEGVETEEQAQFLTTIGCNMAQGFLYSKPISCDDFLSTYYAVKKN